MLRQLVGSYVGIIRFFLVRKHKKCLKDDVWSGHLRYPHLYMVGHKSNNCIIHYLSLVHFPLNFKMNTIICVHNKIQKFPFMFLSWDIVVTIVSIKVTYMTHDSDTWIWQIKSEPKKGPRSKLAISTKSTFYVLSSWNLVKMFTSWVIIFTKFHKDWTKNAAFY